MPTLALHTAVVEPAASNLPISASVLRGIITDVHITGDLVVRLIVLLEAVDDGLMGEVQVQRLSEVKQHVFRGHQVDQFRTLGWTEHRHAFIGEAVWLKKKLRAD